MGVQDVTIHKIWPSSNSEHVVIDGDNFTNWSKVYVNGEKVSTTYVSGSRLLISVDDINDGDTVVVNQMGSANTIFRSSNQVVYDDPDAEAAPAPSGEPEAAEAADDTTDTAGTSDL